MNKEINNNGTVATRFVDLGYVLVFRRGGKQFITLSSTFAFLTLATEVANRNS